MEDLRALFKALDSDRSGKISKAEFLADMEDDPSRQTWFETERFREVVTSIVVPAFLLAKSHTSLFNDFRSTVIFL